MLLSVEANGTDSAQFGFLMLKTSEIRVSSDLNYDNVTKEIRGDFLAGEARTDIADLREHLGRDSEICVLS